MVLGLGTVPLTSVAHARREAKRKLPRSIYWYTEAGTELRRTVRANRDGFKEIGLQARILDSHEPRKLSTTVLGR
ncbi:MAG: alpha-hydroxy-acid oxidizing enzyme, partial [Dehalococcoidia bacterium]|nr:alpha-hydroxy-acid oxidizing enzyme [Dehalococcoidia bacterium]